MAQSNLPVLSSPGFPQVFDALIGRQIERVERVLADCEQTKYDLNHVFDRLRPITRRIRRINLAELSPCAYQSPESSRGACDGGQPCHDLGTVFDLATEQEYCLGHFEEVSRG